MVSGYKRISEMKMATFYCAKSGFYDQNDKYH